MDCRSFRKHHLAYLDDTLSGDQTAAAQRHVLTCDSCAAHDTLVRRSLMVARSMPTIEPSEEFQERLRARLASCRSDPGYGADRAPRFADFTAWPMRRAPRTMAAVAAGALLGTLAWRNFTPAETGPVIAMQPVIATQPEAPVTHPYVTPALMQAMATGNPVWPAALLLEDVQTQLVAADFVIEGEAR